MARSEKITQLQPEQHCEAVWLWSIGLRSWAIGQRLGVAHRRILQWIITHHSEFPLKRRVLDLRTPIVQGLPSRPAVPHVPCLDEVIAAANISGLALYLNFTEERVLELLRLLVAGETVGVAARSVGTDYGKMRAVRKHIGWCYKWRRAGMRYSQTTGSLSKQVVCQLRNNGLTLAAIGLRCGVTRERIRQVCKSSGLVPAHVLSRASTAQRDIDDKWEKELNRQERNAHLAAQAADTRSRIHQDMEIAQHMWKDGATVKDIAAHYKVSINSMSWRIHTERQYYGEDAFPHRSPRRPSGAPA